MEDDSAPSSPDELALSPQSISSPTKRVRRPTTRVSLTTQGNGLPSSPVKSLTMDTASTPGASPWRIKVTVQAEPMPDGSDTEDETSTRNKVRKTVTTKVPLKDVASTTPVKRRGRSRETDGPDVAGKSTKRRSTPTRRNTTIEASLVKSGMVDHVETMGAMTVQSAASIDQASRIAKRAATPLMDDSLRQKVANLNRRISDARACHVVVESSARKTDHRALKSRAMQESDIEDAVNDAQHEEDGNIWDSESLNVAPGKVSTRSPRRQTFTPSKYLRQKIFEDTTLSSQHTEPAEQSPAAVPVRSQDQTLSMSSPLALKEKLEYPTLNRMLNQTCLQSPVPDYDTMSWKPSTPPKRLQSEK
ncbi:hypothetical protein LTR28_008044, partial [Elasticomyces elasticus]